MRPRRWTESDVPDQHGRTVLVTGANGGIGFEVARVLSGRGATVLLGCRDEGRADEAAARLRSLHAGADLAVVPLDLADLASVRDAAARIRDRFARLDLLIANAGVCMPPRQLSADGFELQLATNHLGHFALTGLLLDRLLDTPGSRVVSLTSVTHPLGRIDFADLHHDRRYSRTFSYAQSKLATALFAFELDRRLRAAGAPTRALAAHPGSARTDIARHIPRVEQALSPVASVLQQSAAAGALPVLRAATDPGAEGGELYGPGGPFQWRGRPELVRAARRARDPETQRRLWEVSERLTRVPIPLGVQGVRG